MLIPHIFERTNVIAAQSTRLADIFDPAREEEEKEKFFGELGIELSQIAGSKQVHGNQVLVAESPIRAEGYDAIITNKENVFAVVATADCTPILIFDQKNNAVAAIHAGWRGTVAKIVTQALIAMQINYGTRGEDCLAFIGACICENEFEVGEEVAIQFDESLKRYDPERKKYFVDLKKANQQQLLNFGLSSHNIEISEYCTITDNDKFYSYRKEKGKTGRTFSVIGMV